MRAAVSFVVMLLFTAQEPQMPLSAGSPVGQRADPLTLVDEEVFEARVTSVRDGDSVVITDRGKRLDIHLDGIDAPELSQASGGDARAFLADLLLGKIVTVRRRGRSHASGEAVARLEVNGADASTALLSNGLAWHCARLAATPRLSDAQRVARGGKRGLWKASNPTPPWTHRGVDRCWKDSKGV